MIHAHSIKMDLNKFFNSNISEWSADLIKFVVLRIKQRQCNFFKQSHWSFTYNLAIHSLIDGSLKLSTRTSLNVGFYVRIYPKTTEYLKYAIWLIAELLPEKNHFQTPSQGLQKYFQMLFFFLGNLYLCTKLNLLQASINTYFQMI